MSEIRFSEPSIGEREAAAVVGVLRSGQITRGQECSLFESELAQFLGASGALAVSSGTAALHLALLAVGVQPGDEVIVPATTFVATANAVLYCRAEPVIVDVTFDTWTICASAVKAAITDKTRAIVAVHLYGVPADMDALQAIVDDHYVRTGRRIAIVEDAAEALGAECGGRPVGAIGDAGAFSFYGSKTITTGEGGAVSWLDDRVGYRAAHLHGQSQEHGRRYRHDCEGFNYRMTEIQAAIGRTQLNRIEGFLEHRRTVFEWYRQFLPEVAVMQAVANGDRHGHWACAVRFTGPYAVRIAERLQGACIETRPVFPPLPEMPHLPSAGSIHNARLLHAAGLVLPTHCQLTAGDVERVCDELKKAMSCL